MFYFTCLCIVSTISGSRHPHVIPRAPRHERGDKTKVDDERGPTSCSFKRSCKLKHAAPPRRHLDMHPHDRYPRSYRRWMCGPPPWRRPVARDRKTCIDAFATVLHGLGFRLSARCAEMRWFAESAARSESSPHKTVAAMILASCWAWAPGSAPLPLTPRRRRLAS